MAEKPAAQRRNPLWPMTPAFLDSVWGLLEIVPEYAQAAKRGEPIPPLKDLAPDGRSWVWEALGRASEAATIVAKRFPGTLPPETPEGRRARIILCVLVPLALQEPAPKEAAEWFHKWTNPEGIAKAQYLPPGQQYGGSFPFPQLPATALARLLRRRGRPPRPGVPVTVRVCAVDCLAELCGLKVLDAIKLWNATYLGRRYQFKWNSSEDCTGELPRAYFRQQRRRVRSYLSPPEHAPPKRSRGRPRKYGYLLP